METGRFEIGRIETGKRTIMGTDWPVSTFAEKIVERKGKVKWLVTYKLCNGVPSGSRYFATKREALAELYMDVQEPRWAGGEPIALLASAGGER